MTLFLEKKINLNREELDFFNFVKSNNFPWYHAEIYSSKDSGTKFFNHVLMNRNDYHDNYNDSGGIENSIYFHFCKNFITKICSENKYDIKVFHRMCINFLYHSKDKPMIHLDHKFDHNVFLMYLNTFDEGYTELYDEEDKLIKKIIPEKYKFVIFKGKHTMGFPAENNHKITLVATFSM